MLLLRHSGDCLIKPIRDASILSLQARCCSVEASFCTSGLAWGRPVRALSDTCPHMSTSPRLLGVFRLWAGSLFRSIKATCGNTLFCFAPSWYYLVYIIAAASAVVKSKRFHSPLPPAQLRNLGRKNRISTAEAQITYASQVHLGQKHTNDSVAVLMPCQAYEGTERECHHVPTINADRGRYKECSLRRYRRTGNISHAGKNQHSASRGNAGSIGHTLLRRLSAPCY